MVGIRRNGDLVQWNAGITTKVSVDWTPDWNPNDHGATRLVATSFDDVYVATSVGLFRVVGADVTLIEPGKVLDVSADPASAPAIAARVTTWANNTNTVKLLSISPPGAAPVVEALPPAGPPTY